MARPPDGRMPPSMTGLAPRRKRAGRPGLYSAAIEEPWRGSWWWRTRPSWPRTSGTSWRAWATWFGTTASGEEAIRLLAALMRELLEYGAPAKPVFRDAPSVAHGKAFTYCKDLQSNVTWDALNDNGVRASDDLNAACSGLSKQPARAGHRRIVRCDLTRPGIGVDVLVPSLRFRYR